MPTENPQGGDGEDRHLGDGGCVPIVRDDSYGRQPTHEAVAEADSGVPRAGYSSSEVDPGIAAALDVITRALLFKEEAKQILKGEVNDDVRGDEVPEQT